LLAIDFDAWAPKNAHLLRYVQRQKGAKAAGDNAEKVVRSYAHLAAQLDLPLHAVHVETPKQQRQSATQHTQVERTLKFAQELNATACALLPAA